MTCTKPPHERDSFCSLMMKSSLLRQYGKPVELCENVLNYNNYTHTHRKRERDMYVCLCANKEVIKTKENQITI